MVFSAYNVYSLNKFQQVDKMLFEIMHGVELIFFIFIIKYVLGEKISQTIEHPIFIIPWTVL